MDPSSELINYKPSVGDACLVDCATTHKILRDKKYFSNFTLAQSNVHTISGPVDLIKGSDKPPLFYRKALKCKLKMPFILINLVEIYLVSKILAKMDIILKL